MYYSRAVNYDSRMFGLRGSKSFIVSVPDDANRRQTTFDDGVNEGEERDCHPLHHLHHIHDVQRAASHLPDHERSVKKAGRLLSGSIHVILVELHHGKNMWKLYLRTFYYEHHIIVKRSHFYSEINEYLQEVSFLCFAHNTCKTAQGNALNSCWLTSGQCYKTFPAEDGKRRYF